MTTSGATREEVPAPSPAELAVADMLPVGAPDLAAVRARDAVPIWFHTFQLAPGLYTPGIARDHRYRIPALGPERFLGKRVLDIGAFDGFYSFLAETRGAARVVAVDNEQYVEWVRGRFGVDLEPAAGFDAVHGLLASEVEYRRLDAFDVGRLGEAFDVVLCFGMLHRVTDPVGLLGALAAVLAPGGEIVLETYGARLDDDAPVLEVHEPGDVYPGDDYVFWGFPAEGLRRIAAMVGLGDVELIDCPEIDGHPRIIAVLRAEA
jgi:SAM-dependent methyltransferase